MVNWDRIGYLSWPLTHASHRVPEGLCQLIVLLQPTHVGRAKAALHGEKYVGAYLLKHAGPEIRDLAVTSRTKHIEYRDVPQNL